MEAAEEARPSTMASTAELSAIILRGPQGAHPDEVGDGGAGWGPPDRRGGPDAIVGSPEQAPSRAPDGTAVPAPGPAPRLRMELEPMDITIEALRSRAVRRVALGWRLLGVARTTSDGKDYEIWCREGDGDEALA